jgi:hypothetical protein
MGVGSGLLSERMRRGRLAKYEAGLVGWIIRQGTESLTVSAHR